MAGRIRIGTSGWSYDHWQGRFYPSGLRPAERLAWYARHFSTVEINNSFYHLPGEATLDHWREAVPAGFVFAAKASRFITHMKKLRDPQRTLPPFLSRIGRLGGRLGPILFQMPPRWHCDLPRLADFLAALPPGHRYACEWRDPDWWREEVRALMAEHGVAWCCFDLAGRTAPRWTSADFAYLRLHGPDGPYQGSYSDAQLADWAAQLRRWAADGLDCYCYFDNDAEAWAVHDARRLKALLAAEGAP